MSSPVYTASLSGLAPRLLEVESSFISGFAKLQVVGSVGDISRDGSERVRSAMEKINQPVPNHRIVVSVTPADVPKDGNHFDLPVAVSLLQLMSSQPWSIDPAQWLFAGELALDGKLRATRGGIAFATVALREQLLGMVVPRANLRELMLMQGLNPERFGKLRIMAFEHLSQVQNWCESGRPLDLEKISRLPLRPVASKHAKTFDDMKLTPDMQRLACAIGVGRHSCLLRGSPGSGKTMFAERIPSILPSMDPEDHLQALSVHTAASAVVPPEILAGRPPFRAPHHQASAPSLLGTNERPGDLSMAHGGVLFLDEFPEFRRDVIEALREPLESGWVQINRAKEVTNWCAKVILIAAANNCPCGWYGSSRVKCGCPHPRIRAYRDKLSGPILDRIDLHVDIPEPDQPASDLFTLDQHESITEQMRATVEEVNARTRARNQTYGVSANRDLPAKHLLACGGIDHKTLEQWLGVIAEGQVIGHRGIVRLLRVARTFADLDESSDIAYPHLTEAWRWHATGAALARGDRFSGL